MLSLQYSRSSRYPYLIIYLFLLFKAGFYFNENNSLITSAFLIGLLFVFISKSHKAFTKKGLNIVIILIALQFVTFLFKGFPPLPVYGLSLVNHLTAILIVSAFSFKEFCGIYSDVILLCCITSIICLLAQILGIPFYSVFPVLTNSAGVSAHFLVLSDMWLLKPDLLPFNRMAGFFWEPGAFQAMIVFAAVIDLFSDKTPKELWPRLIIYTLSIVLTFSTTGFLSLIILLALSFKKLSKYGNVAVILFLCVGFSLITYLLNSTSGFIYYSLFGKLENVSNVISGGDATATESVRVDSVIYPLRLFMDSPILGIGYAGEEQMSKILGHSMFTCTPVNIIVKYGLLYGFIFYRGIFRLLSLRKKSFLEALLLFVVVILTTSSEALDSNPILESFMLFGYISSRRDKGMLAITSGKGHINN